MRFFALDTDLAEVKKRFFSDHEEELMEVYHHGLSFLFALIKQTIVTIVIVGVGIAGYSIGLDAIGFLVTLLLIWIVFVFTNILKAYLDWSHDVLIITTDKVILIDQTSILKCTITPINLENFASVSAETQYFNVFPFGKVVFNLKEGVGGEIVLKYIPDHRQVAACVSGCVTRFQRRQPPVAA